MAEAAIALRDDGLEGDSVEGTQDCKRELKFVNPLGGLLDTSVQGDLRFPSDSWKSQEQPHLYEIFPVANCAAPCFAEACLACTLVRKERGWAFRCLNTPQSSGLLHCSASQFKPSHSTHKTVF
eukprot:6466588-Amphidinium_carterae.2